MKHETQRLLVAASRGARVQVRWGISKRWVPCSFVGLRGVQQRIHPEDTALQYGPVSTELRKIAEADLFEWSTWLWYWVRKHVGQIGFLTKDEARWLCALAAELAADEGM